MKGATVSMILLAVTPTASPAQGRPTDVPRQIYGKVQVVDSVTFQFINSRQVVRLAGYEAPRLEQTATSDDVTWPAGQVSRAWMILRTLGQNVNCTPIGRDTNKVLIAHCFVGETNLAAAAIAEGIGYAFNYRNEPQVPAYFDIERKARGLGFGVWSSPDLLPPWLYTVSIPNDAQSDSRSPESAVGLPLPLPATPDGPLSFSDTHGG
ncbi:thermonuclease family protein [Neorhizobium galegae]|uniref:thermonuclease family protein n=1 Tax=Neorhizobium galegae TaxID=399 RepID=UPI0006214014|nr:thermonuclease family protein [Neorhizobium galegae]MCQ1768136.1 thermonuclease family protein [Neorhizobium galegae]MCQ1847108.1 thermonuclease family protein [Neorhizobium galegae]CDZ29955.1 SNase domain protein [Neorhizobium galegae bv. officinalis]CDZ34191.1 SNase domain protein [Neorhizobium galegae bv. officinalis]